MLYILIQVHKVIEELLMHINSLIRMRAVVPPNRVYSCVNQLCKQTKSNNHQEEFTGITLIPRYPKPIIIIYLPALSENSHGH